MKFFKHILTVLVVCSSQFAFAQDVYNFYFQKSNGENKVIQNKNGQLVEQNTDSSSTIAPTNLTPISPVASSVSADSTEIAKPELVKKWKLLFGKSFGLLDYSYVSSQGVYLGADYTLNKYFALNGDISFEQSHNPVGQTNEWGVISQSDQSEEVVFSVGLMARPLKLNVFGWGLLEWHVGAGLWNPISSDQHPNSFGGVTSYSQKVSPYAKSSVLFNITNNLSLDISMKQGVTEGSMRTSQIGIGYNL